MVRLAAAKQVGFTACRGKLAEVVEKTMKAELIRLGWALERTHDLEHLLDELVARKSDLIPRLETLCDSLADAYFSDRYPGFDLEDPIGHSSNCNLKQCQSSWPRWKAGPPESRCSTLGAGTKNAASFTSPSRARCRRSPSAIVPDVFPSWEGSGVGSHGAQEIRPGPALSSLALPQGTPA
jgi:hypothetical protein